ncbi:SagB/ThcOx family dehydrogenase [Trichloromonas sp.]|uniref:SagB/ThcOx family dehydrogenase n=1 Tax=Trichloromonas sp. TaxID=3069249 RepID=UPI003D818B66
MKRDDIRRQREFLKDSLRLQINFQLTDQSQGVEPPPLQKPAKDGQALIPLPGKEAWQAFAETSLLAAIEKRQSRRRFKPQPLLLSELAFLLWATQGIKEVVQPGSAFRVVPSAGCRHAFETYLAVSEVEGLAPGIYRYLPIEHALVFEHSPDNLRAELSRAALGQSFVASAPVTFIWACLPYRMEWRYHTAAHRVIALDAGHVCQNLYLACEAIGAGTCAIAAYNQELMDQLLEIDGEEEFTLYLAPAGKV